MQKHLDENEMPLSVVWVFCRPDIKQLDPYKHLDDTEFFIFHSEHKIIDSPAWQELKRSSNP